jgi:hypothetical protein
MRFEILGEISNVETFAAGSGIREIARLRRMYGRGRWRKRKGIANVRLMDGSVRVAELHWYEASAIGRKEFEIRRMSKKQAKHLVVCVENDGYAASLEKRKIYVAIPDADGEKHGLLRIIDESGEDYLYPKAFFRAIALPQAVRKAVFAAA